MTAPEVLDPGPRPTTSTVAAASSTAGRASPPNLPSPLSPPRLPSPPLRPGGARLRNMPSSPPAVAASSLAARVAGGGWSHPMIMGGGSRASMAWVSPTASTAALSPRRCSISDRTARVDSGRRRFAHRGRRALPNRPRWLLSKAVQARCRRRPPRVGGGGGCRAQPGRAQPATCTVDLRYLCSFLVAWLSKSVVPDTRPCQRLARAPGLGGAVTSHDDLSRRAAGCRPLQGSIGCQRSVYFPLPLLGAGAWAWQYILIEVHEAAYRTVFCAFVTWMGWHSPASECHPIQRPDAASPAPLAGPGPAGRVRFTLCAGHGELDGHGGPGRRMVT